MVRGDARILQSLLEREDSPLNGVKLFGIVKETGVDDEGLNDFATEYFPYPLYKDAGLVYYNALGSGKLSIGWNPLAMIKLILDSKKRISESGVKSHNMKGEGFLQGGWIIFDADGQPKHAYQEDAKQRIPGDQIAEDLINLRKGNS